MTRRSRAGAVLGGLLAVAGAGNASAHAGHPILRAERTLKLEADGQAGLRFVVTVHYGAEQMLRVARQVDRNGNGFVEDAEVATYMDGWAEELRERLPMRLDGARPRPRFSRPFFDPTGAISLRPGTLEIVAEIDLGGGRHELLLVDDMAESEFDRTDVMFESTNGASVSASGPLAAPTEIVPSFAYGRATETRRPRSIGFVFEMPTEARVAAASRSELRALVPIGIPFAASAFAVVLGRLLRAMRVRDATKSRRAA